MIKMRARFINEAINEPTEGLDAFMERLIDAYPKLESYRNRIEDFINKSDCKKIRFEHFNAAAGFSLFDGVVLNSGILRQFSSTKFLYSLFHEIAHQYQYKKYGEEKMYEFYIGEIPVEELAKFMQSCEITADRFAIGKLKQLGFGWSGKGFYEDVPLSHFIKFIQEIRNKIKIEGITDYRNVSKFMYNYIKNHTGF